MAEDSVFDSGLSGMIPESDYSCRKSHNAAWENELLDSMSSAEIEDHLADPIVDLGTTRTAANDSIFMRDPNAGTVQRTGLAEHSLSADLSNLANEEDRVSDSEISKVVTAQLYGGQNPKQINEFLLLMYPAARIEAFWRDQGRSVARKYGKLGYLYIDAADFSDDNNMDDTLGGQKKIGQLALEFIKPAPRCDDCVLNKSGFCTRYNLTLDERPSIRNARQARNVLTKFARVSNTSDEQMSEVHDRIDSASKNPEADYDGIVSGFLASIGQLPRKKGDTGRARLAGETDDAIRPAPGFDAEIDEFVRVRAISGAAGLTELRKMASDAFGSQRAKKWFRSNHSEAIIIVQEARRARVADKRDKQRKADMDAVRKGMITLYGERRARRLISARGDDPSSYVELLSRTADDESRRIGTGDQHLREIPDVRKSRKIGHLDDELRQLVVKFADRGISVKGIRLAVAQTCGDNRLREFEASCPGEIERVAKNTALKFGAADEKGFEMFEKDLAENHGDADVAMTHLRTVIGRARTKRLLAEHPKVGAAIAASSRMQGEAASVASDRRVGGYASVLRSLKPELDFDALAREAADIASQKEPEPRFVLSNRPVDPVNPTLVSAPDMESTDVEYGIDGSDMPDPVF